MAQLLSVVLKLLQCHVFFAALLRGASGVLRVQETFVVSTFAADGFTTFDLPGGKRRFSLIPFKEDFVSITDFRVRADDICADGSSFKLDIRYYSKTEVVSLSLLRKRTI